MNNQERFRPVLQAEMGRWAAKPIERLLAELRNVQTYPVKFEAMEYQVEVQLLENTDEYLHVLVAVDDGTFFSACRPLTESFILNKTER